MSKQTPTNPIASPWFSPDAATISVGASDNREIFLLPNCHKIELPLAHKALGKVETLLKNRDVAVFIMELIICNFGAVVPEKDFIRGVRKLLEWLPLHGPLICGYPCIEIPTENRPITSLLRHRVIIMLA